MHDFVTIIYPLIHSHAAFMARQERPAQRQNWRRKLKELAGDRDFLREQVNRHNSVRLRAGREAREREELLERRNAASVLT